MQGCREERLRIGLRGGVKEEGRDNYGGEKLATEAGTW